MKNIYLLPTDKPSNLFLGTRTNKLYIIPIGDIGIPQHIYITSDEEPKHLHYYITKITDSNGERYVVGQRLDINDSDYSNCKKIILTTDQDLIKDGIQYIDDEFLEWFIKNTTCEFVEVKKQMLCDYCGQEHCDNLRCRGYKDSPYYEIIIPQEEPKCTCKIGEPYNNACCKVHGSVSKEELKQDFSDKNYTPELELLGKQETIEEAAERIYPIKSSGGAMEMSNRHQLNNFYKQEGFKKCAIWMQERMYSEEDLRKAFKAGGSILSWSDFGVRMEFENFEKWFEQFKKKKK